MKRRSNEAARASLVMGLSPFVTKPITGGTSFAVEKKILKPDEGALKLFRQGVKGRGFGSAFGSGASGVLAGPLYISGLSNFISKDKKQQQKGVAQLAAASVAHSLISDTVKGGFEGAAAGKRGKDLLRAGASLGVSSVPVRLLAGAASAASIKSGRKKNSKGGKYLAPTLTGAGLGAGTLAAHRALNDLVSRKPRELGGKKLKARLIGGAISGAMGGAISAKMADILIPKKKPRRSKTKSAVSAAALSLLLAAPIAHKLDALRRAKGLKRGRFRWDGHPFFKEKGAAYAQPPARPVTPAKPAKPMKPMKPHASGVVQRQKLASMMSIGKTLSSAAGRVSGKARAAWRGAVDEGRRLRRARDERLMFKGIKDPNLRRLILTVRGPGTSNSASNGRLSRLTQDMIYGVDGYRNQAAKALATGNPKDAYRLAAGGLGGVAATAALGGVVAGPVGVALAPHALGGALGVTATKRLMK